jgi:sigma-B regulation protein RsbU (phosphoserine phosphatase)
MSSIPELQVREELLTRRARLGATREASAAVPVAGLIAQIDAALARLDEGTYGLCETCHDPIEPDRLLADPLTTFCLDHLTAEQRVTLEHDLELARDIQRALLPPNDGVLAGWDLHYIYLPLGTVSGDYCDVIDAGSAVPNVAVGDVSGKGVAASLLMSNLHALFRSLTHAGLPLCDTVQRANHLFCASTLPSSFATVAFARLDPAGVVELCNAGHCPPLVVRRNRVEVIPPTGLAMGLFADAQFRTSTHRLDAGDLLVFYTDGLTETFDGTGNEYGSERLTAVLERHRDAPPRELTRACLRDVDAFAAGAPRRDDATIMVVRRTGYAS